MIASLNPFWCDGAVMEVRAPKAGHDGPISGYFNDAEKLHADAQALDGRVDVDAVYVTMNEVNPALLARAKNRLQRHAKLTTTDADILRRRWLLIDCDPKRPAQISSTDEEKAAAFRRMVQVRDFLRVLGWPEPIECDSGNGWHLLYRVDEPNDDATRELFKRVLAALARRFDDTVVVIDQTVFNASRICKLYGTQAKKGDDTAERPHRYSRVLTVPSPLTPVSRTHLEDLAAHGPVVTPAPAASRASEGGFDLPAFIARHGLSVSSEKPWEGGTLYQLRQCPFNQEHLNSACLTHTPKGFGFKCQHNTCAAYHWQALRDKLEPNRTSFRAAPAQSGHPGLVRLVTADTVTPENVQWAEQGRIPLSAVTLFAGIPGKGKTMVMGDFIARVSRGTVPGLLFGAPARSLILSTEDSIKYTLVPRLMAAGADLSLISFVQMTRDDLVTGFTVPDDLDKLSEQIRDLNVRVFGIDPLIACLPERLNAHRDQDIRRALAPLYHFSEAHGLATVGVSHFNKQQCADVLNKVGGSVGLVAAARSVLFVSDDPENEGQRLFAHAKCNLAPFAPILRFCIEGRPVPGKDGPIETARIRWLGEAEGVTADDLLTTLDAKERQDRKNVLGWLSDFLRDGKQPSTALDKAAQQQGYSHSTVNRGKKKLGVISRKDSFAGGWYCWLPDTVTEEEITDAD